MSNIRFLLNNAKQSISRGKTVIDKIVSIHQVFYNQSDRYVEQIGYKQESGISTKVSDDKLNTKDFNDNEWNENSNNANPDYNPWE